MSADPAETHPPTVALHNVHKRYGSQVVLQGLDLTVPRGAVYGFLGRNGSGKTTTLRTLLGLQRFDSGTIELFGTQVRQIGIAEKQRIGFVGQDQKLYPWMRADDLRRLAGPLYPTWDDARFTTLLQRFDVPTDRRVDAMSGGTRVKLSLCIALAASPELLILDEPTAGLDPVARRDLLDLIALQAREEGRTTLFSGHVVSEIESVADHIGLLDSGRLQWEGRLDDLGRWHRVVPADRRGSLPAELRLIGPVSRSEGADWMVCGPPDVWESAAIEGAPAGLEAVFLGWSLYRTDR
jgi:ABC-2 type transport system ATP-binding protein